MIIEFVLVVMVRFKYLLMCMGNDVSDGLTTSSFGV